MSNWHLGMFPRLSGRSTVPRFTRWPQTSSDGLTIVLGYTGQINLAQAAFFGLGAYSVALGTANFGLPFWPALLAGVVIASAAGAVLGLTSLRLGGHYLAMVTISFQQVLTLVLNNWTSFTSGPDGIPGIARPMVSASRLPTMVPTSPFALGCSG
jgi:branched-chain amino acid transport system permease protein